MSSKILSVSEKTRQQFLQQKITYRDPNRVEWSLVVSVLSARENIGIVAGIYESKSVFGGVYYLTVLVCTKTKRLGKYPPLTTDTEVNSC